MAWWTASAYEIFLEATMVSLRLPTSMRARVRYMRRAARRRPGWADGEWVSYGRYAQASVSGRAGCPPERARRRLAAGLATSADLCAVAILPPGAHAAGVTDVPTATRCGNVCVLCALQHPTVVPTIHCASNDLSFLERQTAPILHVRRTRSGPSGRSAPGMWVSLRTCSSRVDAIIPAFLW